MKKRLLSAVLAGSMMLTMLPATAFAADETGQEQVDSQEPGTSSGSETALEYVFKAANVSGKYDEDSYKVDVTKKEANGLAYYEAAISITGLQEHKSGTGSGAGNSLGYWVGVTLGTPEEATGYKWNYSGCASLEDLEKSISEQKTVNARVAVEDDTFNWYFNAGSPTRDESWVGVEFYKGETDQYTPLEKPIYIHLNFDNVKLDAEASYTKDGKVGYASLAQAIKNVEENGTVTLLKDATLTEKVSISKDVTIDGAGFTITGKSDDANVNFEVTDGTLTMKNAKLTGFGDTASTVTGAGVFKIPSNSANAKIVAENLTVEKFNRAAFDARAGEFTITNTTIDCDNGQTERLTKGIVAWEGAVKGQVSGCTITGSNSTYEGWSANGIEISSGSTVAIKDTTIESMKGGISVARNAGNGAADVTVENCTVTATDYALRIFESNNSTSAVEGSSAKLTVNGGNYSGDVRISLADNGTTDKKSEIVITGGYFTNDPTEFLATGKAAVTSDKDGYNYMVDEAGDNPAEIVVADPAVDSELEFEEDSQEAALLDQVTTALNPEQGTAPSLDETTLTAAVATIANDNKVTADSALDALKEATKDEDLTAEGITIVVQPYMAIKVTGITVDAETNAKSMTLDITPMYKTVATTADLDTNDQIVLAGEGINAVQIGEAEALPITNATEVTVPLPTDFVAAGTISVAHDKNGVIHIYSGTVEDNVLTFTTYGFSEFTIPADVTAVATINGVGYTSLQDAVNEVAEDQIIMLVGTLTADQMTATVNEPKSFIVNYGENTTADVNITATSGLKFESEPAIDETAKTITYTVISDGSLPPTEDEGGSSGGSGSTTYAVSVNTAANGTVSVSPRNASKGATVTITVTPNEGYVLGTLTATDANGDTISLTNAGNGKYTFTMPSSKVTISATFVAEGEQELPFTDVASSEWYYEAVQYVYNNELMNGMSATTFEPNSTTTRGMIVTMLYRLENEPTAASAGFTDVAAGQWYTDAVNWAAANNIVNGYGDDQFGPTDTITREQMMAILYRYAQYKGYDVTASADLSAYTDAANISSYAVSAMQWAVGEGLINGITDTTLVPGGSATRAQVAAILMRFCENVAK